MPLGESGEEGHDIVGVLLRMRGHSASPRRGRRPLLEVRDDLLREVAQVLKQDEAERRRKGPQLREEEGGDLLVGPDERGDLPLAERVVGVLGERPHHLEHARSPPVRPAFEAGQDSVERPRQAFPHLIGLLPDEVEVVEEPVSGRRERLLFLAARLRAR